MALKSKEPVPPTVPTAEPTPEICCVVCDKVCNFDNEEAKWSGDEDPVPTCSKGCRMYYYSQKGITDYFELEGISEDDSLRMIEQHLRNRRGNASASSDDFELVEDYTGRMQQRVHDPEILKARTKHISKVITQSGFMDLWLQLTPEQSLAFRWQDEEVDGNRRSKLLFNRVAVERVMPRTDDEQEETWVGLEDTLSSSDSSERTSCLLYTSPSPRDPM